ncbi:MAG: Kazal-type serine protease inhibitor family protein [Bacteroidetes bacterium]|nr:Kazal-type serine protease inhibitor family protein [Bacteroidota bacterium]
MKKSLKKISSVAILLLVGFYSCETDQPKPVVDPVVDECHDKSLISESPYKGAWMYNDPVCGCDGQTYINKDVAVFQHGVIKYTKGPCAKKHHHCDEQCDHESNDECHDVDLIGSVQFFCKPYPNPVCGCDNVTYDSPEEAMYTYGVKSYTPGACKIKDEPCLAVYEPVCGNDGITYSNYCEAIKAGATVYSKGACKIIEPPVINECHGTPWPDNTSCIALYEPVCGCDGRSYSNSCEAARAGILHYTDGKCGGIIDPTADCIDQSKINLDAICPAYEAPVCGCNFVTYGNSCEAEAAGVKFYSPGPCLLKPTGGNILLFEGK